MKTEKKFLKKCKMSDNVDDSFQQHLQNIDEEDHHGFKLHMTCYNGQKNSVPYLS